MLAQIETPRAHRPVPRLVAVAGVRQDTLTTPPVVVTVSGLAVKLVRGSTHNFTLRVSDWLMALMLASLGLVLRAQPSMFDAPHGFAVLAQMGTAEDWDDVFLLLGSVRLLALFVNGTFDTFRFSPHVRFVFSMASCFVWFQMALGLTLTPTITAAFAVYPYLLLFDLYNTFLAASEAGVSERRHRHVDR